MTDYTKQQAIRETFDRRVSVRVYDLARPVARNDMETILDAAWLSPSSVGLEGWRFLVLDRAHIEAIRPDLAPLAWGAQPQLETASHFVILLAETDARYDSPAMRASLIRRGLTAVSDINNRLALYETFQRDHMGIADNPRALADWTAKQTYIALANMMTTAAYLGIDSCPIEGFDYPAVNALLAAKGWLDPAHEGVASMLALGYRLKDPKHPRSRKPREAVVTWVE